MLACARCRKLKHKQAMSVLNFPCIVFETTFPIAGLLKKNKNNKTTGKHTHIKWGVKRTCVWFCETMRRLNTSKKADVVNVLSPPTANLPQFVELINAKQMMYKAIIERSCLSVPRTSRSMHGARPGSAETASRRRCHWQQRLTASVQSNHQMHQPAVDGVSSERAKDGKELEVPLPNSKLKMNDWFSIQAIWLFYLFWEWICFRDGFLIAVWLVFVRLRSADCRVRWEKKGAAQPQSFSHLDFGHLFIVVAALNHLRPTEFLSSIIKKVRQKQQQKNRSIPNQSIPSNALMKSRFNKQELLVTPNL